MLRYFYAWTPLFIVAAVAALSLPWLGLIALMIAAPLALLTLAIGIVFVPYLLIQAISRRVQGWMGASPRPEVVLSPAAPQPTFRKGYVA